MNLLGLLLLALTPGCVYSQTPASIDRCPTDLPSTTTVRLFQGTCYQFVSQERYWTGARDYCIQYGGRLVKIDDSATNEFIKSTLNGLWWQNRGVWIGLHDNNVELGWQWVGDTRYTDETASWFNWASGHPGSFMHSFRDCVRMVRSGGRWLWHETPCTALRWKYRFICQYEMSEPTSTEDPVVGSTLGFGILRDGSDRGRPDSLDHRGDRASTTASTAERTLPATTSADIYEDSRFEYVLGSSLDEQHEAEQHNSVSANWVIMSICLLASCVILLLAVLLWRRRADRRLRLVAVATDDSHEKPSKKDFLVSPSPASSNDQLNLLLSEAKPCAKYNHYEPEPRPLKVTVAQEGRGKDLEAAVTLAVEYCPMDGRKADSRPARPDSGYLPMVLPPDYNSCISQDPKVAYANAEGSGERNIDMRSNIDMMDCGMMGYDVPPPMNVYSDIPDDDGIFDEDGNHIYEAVDVAKPL